MTLIIVVAAVTIGLSITRAMHTQLQISGHALVLDTVTREVNDVCRQTVEQYADNDLLKENRYQDAGVDLMLNTERCAILAGQIADACARDLANYATMTITIPLGAMLGSTTWADRGKKTTYTMAVAYATTCDYHICHEEVGINQVRYALYMQITTQAHITIPHQIEDVRYVYYLPVCERVYSGQVPNVYVNGDNATNYLDLLP